MTDQREPHYNDSLSSLEPGTFIKDRYCIERCVGKGASSIVYRALDTQLASLPVAIKVFNQSFMNLPHFSEMYSRELQSSFAVDHENVVRLYDMIRTRSLIALVTEFVDGITLDEYAKLNGRVLPDSAVRKIVIGIVRGLSAIHAKGLIHRDVKPQNVLISQDGAIKINDFGVAKIEDSTVSSRNAQSRPGSSSVTGTPYYSDPEYLAGGKYDVRSDLHSVGIIAFELLSGRELFDTSSPASFLISKVESPIPPVRTVARNCNEQFAVVIDTLLARNSNNRFQSAVSTLQALEQIPQGSGEIIITRNSDVQDDELIPEHMVRNTHTTTRRSGSGRKSSLLSGGTLLYPVTAAVIYYLVYYTNLWSWLINHLT